jgi:hypothetical protein
MAMSNKPDPTKDPEFQKVVRHLLNTPPKPHSEMKLGKGKPVPNKKSNESKTRPASKGRVHKGKTHS